jgi:cysteine desulfurase
MAIVFLDNNATTPVLPEVLDGMLPYFREQFGNASSAHTGGRRALDAIKRARSSVSSLLGCRPSEIVFTSGGTEGDNLALLGLLSPGDHIITSIIEHKAILQTCKHLRRLGCEVTQVGINNGGQVDPKDIRDALQANTKLISVMMANNETGVLQPLREIGEIAKKAGVYFHTDAVQAVGKIPFSVDEIGCDLLTITAHKMHGPLGIGALYVRRGTPLVQQLHGGNQESGRRPGTENLPGIVGMGLASEIALRDFSDGSLTSIALWRDKFEHTVLEQIPNVIVNGSASPRVPNTSNICFDGISADFLVRSLDARGVAISRCAACTSFDHETSSVLIAMGLSAERSRSSVRISLGKTNTPEDIRYLNDILPETVRTLRENACYFREPQNAMRT